MSDLDKKLIEILRWCKEQETWNDFLKKSGKMEPETGDYTSVEAACLVSLRQAFADGGLDLYDRGLRDGKLTTRQLKDAGLLSTGQEWYSRFCKELTGSELPQGRINFAHTESTVLEAAQRAAGIDHE